MTYRKEHIARGTQVAVVDSNGKVQAVFDLDEEGEADALVNKMNREQGNTDADLR